MHDQPSHRELDGQVCGLFAVDIAEFTQPRRDDDIQVYMHQALYRMLEAAFDKSGLPWSRCCHEDRGDGVLVVLPPALSVSSLIVVPDKLLPLIRFHNRVSCDAAQMELRAAVHIGLVHHDSHGFIGGDVNLLCRLLDSRQLKQGLAEANTEIAVIASDYFYATVIRRQPSLTSPAQFRRLNVRVKETRARAWTHLPGR